MTFDEFERRFRGDAIDQALLDCCVDDYEPVDWCIFRVLWDLAEKGLHPSVPELIARIREWHALGVLEGYAYESALELSLDADLSLAFIGVRAPFEQWISRIYDQWPPYLPCAGDTPAEHVMGDVLQTIRDLCGDDFLSLELVLGRSVVHLARTHRDARITEVLSGILHLRDGGELESRELEGFVLPEAWRLGQNLCGVQVRLTRRYT